MPRGILINITGSSSLKLNEVNAASTLIQDAAHEDANIIFGAVLDEKMADQIKITVIATGFRDRNDNSSQRRDYMLQQSALPTQRAADIPVVLIVKQTAPTPATPVYQAVPIVAAATTPVSTASEAATPVNPLFAAMTSEAATWATEPAPTAFEPEPSAAAPPVAPPAPWQPAATEPTFASALSSAFAAPIILEQPNTANAEDPFGLDEEEDAPPTYGLKPIVDRPVSRMEPIPVVQAAQQIPAQTPPVPASIFDDDFFLRGRRRADSDTHDTAREPQLRTDVRVPTFGGLAPSNDIAEDDELDIPAFLRRGNH